MKFSKIKPKLIFKQLTDSCKNKVINEVLISCFNYESEEFKVNYESEHLNS